MPFKIFLFGLLKAHRDVDGTFHGAWPILWLWVGSAKAKSIWTYYAASYSNAESISNLCSAFSASLNAERGPSERGSGKNRQ
jgi:hypothetical protein